MESSNKSKRPAASRNVKQARPAATAAKPDPLEEANKKSKEFDKQIETSLFQRIRQKATFNKTPPKPVEPPKSSPKPEPLPKIAEQSAKRHSTTDLPQQETLGVHQAIDNKRLTSVDALPVIEIIFFRFFFSPTTIRSI